jgi:hypothetical protein
MRDFGTAARRLAIVSALAVGIGGIGGWMAQSANAQTADCDPSYPTLCLPNYGYNAFNCADVGATDFPVNPPDVNGLDGDHDGVGCESY